MYCTRWHGSGKLTKAPSGKVVIQYKNWESDKQENRKPFSPDPEQWLTIVRVSGICHAMKND